MLETTCPYCGLSVLTDSFGPCPKCGAKFNRPGQLFTMTKPVKLRLREVGDEISFTEMVNVLKAGGECRFHGWKVKIENDEDGRSMSKSMRLCELGDREYVVKFHDGHNEILMLYQCYIDQPWYITKLPPAPAPTTEELLREIIDLLGDRYKSGHSYEIVVSNWFDKARKFLKDR